MSLRHSRLVAALVASVVAHSLSPGPTTAQSAQTPEQHVAAIKQSLQDSQARLRGYEWTETTIISLKGEEKSRKLQRCFYGADGKVQKLPIGEPPEAQPSAPSRGRRGGGRVKQAVIENKKDDMSDYMERAAALIHQYVPPQAAAIQKVKDAGKLAVTPIDQGRVRLELPDYLQPGDRLAIDIDPTANNLTGLNVATYLDEPEDVVALDVQFDSLTDGTRYTAQTTLDAKAKNIRVVIQNGGYRPLKQ